MNTATATLNQTTQAKKTNKDNIVVFRVFNDGEIICFFPYVSFSHNGRFCCSFMAGEGHGAADTDLIKQTRPATSQEIKTSLAILQSIGYKDLIVKKRIQHYFSYLYRLANQ